MGIYAVTGGSGSIGKKTIELLKKRGHEVINIDIYHSDIEADLSIPEGRQKALDELASMCPDGIDGLICSAGVSGSCGNPEMIVSLNFFGTIAMVNGAYDLLLKKRGTCVIVTSNVISQYKVRMDLVDLLNNSSEDEYRICKLISRMDKTDLSTGTALYVASKYALTRWMRRRSASYAANGVRINAVAPGNIHTAMTATRSMNEKMALNALPIPTKYGKETLMESIEIAYAIVFLASSEACGINGIVMFVDGGTDALLNAEKVY
ncbi:MAG: SDR family oxidoreductase [Lachnospiraceae bacterium]|nr:SDR family oxidoreductase [Lachnospiraceae bacterium]